MGFVRFNCGGRRCHCPQPSICFSYWRFLSPSPAAEMNVWLHPSYRNWQDMLQPPAGRDLLYLPCRIASQSHSGTATRLRSGGSSGVHRRAPPAAWWQLGCALEVMDVRLGAGPQATRGDLAMGIAAVTGAVILYKIEVPLFHSCSVKKAND